MCVEEAELWIWLIPSEKQWDQGLDLSHLGPAPHSGWYDLMQPIAKEKGQNNSFLPAGT